MSVAAEPRQLGAVELKRSSPSRAACLRLHTPRGTLLSTGFAAATSDSSSSCTGAACELELVAMPRGLLVCICQWPGPVLLRAAGPAQPAAARPQAGLNTAMAISTIGLAAALQPGEVPPSQPDSEPEVPLAAWQPGPYQKRTGGAGSCHRSDTKP